MKTKEEIQAKIDTLAILEGDGHLDSRICVDKIHNLKIKLKNSKSIADLAPDIIHVRLCSELVKLARKHSDKKAKDVPEWLDLLKTIETIEKIYPETTMF